MSDAARIAEEARKLIRIIEEGNKAYVQHTLTYGQIVALLHLVVRLAEVAMELAAAVAAIEAVREADVYVPWLERGEETSS